MLKNNTETSIFSCSFGLWPFRKNIELYSSSLILNGKTIPLKEVTGLRWGTDKVRGGIFPRYVYVAAFSCYGRECVIKTGDKAFYSALTGLLCRNLLPHVIRNICGEIAQGGFYKVTEELCISDDGIKILKSGLRGKRECFYAWQDIRSGVEAGYLWLLNGEECVDSLSLMRIPNAQVLEAMLSVKREKECRLSEVCNFI